jgi:hypothetical protein
MYKIRKENIKMPKRSVIRRTSLSPPLSLSATSGDTNGEIDLIWEPVSGANTYVIQKGNDSNRPVRWMHEDIVAKSSCTVTKLKSGRVYWFRVAAVGVGGQGTWSEPVRKRSP